MHTETPSLSDYHHTGTYRLTPYAQAWLESETPIFRAEHRSARALTIAITFMAALALFASALALTIGSTPAVFLAVFGLLAFIALAVIGGRTATNWVDASKVIRRANSTGLRNITTAENVTIAMLANALHHAQANGQVVRIPGYEHTAVHTRQVRENLDVDFYRIPGIGDQTTPGRQA